MAVAVRVGAGVDVVARRARAPADVVRADQAGLERFHEGTQGGDIGGNNVDGLHDLAGYDDGKDAEGEVSVDERVLAVVGFGYYGADDAG